MNVWVGVRGRFRLCGDLLSDRAGFICRLLWLAGVLVYWCVYL